MESPDAWTLGIIKAIYKNKGDPNDPDNYRAISLVSSLETYIILMIKNCKILSYNRQQVNL